MEELLLTLKNDHISVIDLVRSPVLVPSGNHLVTNQSIQVEEMQENWIILEIT